jgi:hypothetical protein
MPSCSPYLKESPTRAIPDKDLSAMAQGFSLWGIFPVFLFAWWFPVIFLVKKSLVL